MAPLRPVRTLYDCSLDEALNVVYGYILKYHADLQPIRIQLIGMLHGGIREHLIDRSIAKSSFSKNDVLKVLKVLADSTTKKLQFKENTEFLNGSQMLQLYSIIDSSNIIGLHEFHAKLKIEESALSQVEILTSSIIHSVLRRGLANHLRILALHNAADNETLKIIGQNALCLTHLDITLSWPVDDIGIGDLLLNDATEVIKAHIGSAETCEPETIEALARIPKSQINRTCETLQEVRIQGTNTTSISVLLLLMFSTNLKSFGGFLYDRNIGDAVLSVQSRDSAQPHLPLTELWDTHLPLEKLEKISTYLPKLSSLYTRAAWLPLTPGILPPLTSLTADFDFVHYGPVLYPFLSISGASIRKLTLIDQVYQLDISQISVHCPNLEDLTAKVTVEEGSTNVEMTHLLNAKVRISEPSTFTWIMRHAPNIQKFESLFECIDYQDMLENAVIMRLINEKPRSLNSIKHLIMFNCFSFGSRTLTIEAAYALCEACDNLEVLGELKTWHSVTKENVQMLNEHIRKNNWDINISFENDVHLI